VEIIKEVPVEVIKEVFVNKIVEVVKEVPVEVIKEVEKIKIVEVIKEVDRNSKVKKETSRSNGTVRREDMGTTRLSLVQDVTETVATPIPVKKDPDNLKVVEGIGPKIEQLLNNSGIKTYEDLASARLDDLQMVLTKAGSRFTMHDPKTWSRQAGLASAGKWDELKQWQDELDGGKE